MLKLAYIDLQDYLDTLQTKHQNLNQQLKDVEKTLEENQILRKIKRNIHKSNNNSIVMRVKSDKLKENSRRRSSSSSCCSIIYI